MRIEQTKQTVQTVGDIVSVETDRLVIETPDPEPASPVVVNMTFAEQVGLMDGMQPNLKPGTHEDMSKWPLHFDCHQPGENLAAFHEVHPELSVAGFHASDFASIEARGRIPDAPAPVFDEHEFQAKARRDHPNRDIPLWAFQRDFILQEFPNLGPHGAAKLADHFMDQWRRSYHRPAGRSDGQGSRPI